MWKWFYRFTALVALVLSLSLSVNDSLPSWEWVQTGKSILITLSIIYLAIYIVIEILFLKFKK